MHRQNTRITIKRESLVIPVVIIILSMLSFIVTLLDISRPAYYSLLPLMPLSYMVLTIVFMFLFDNILYNLGAVLIIAFEGLRMVLGPFFIVLSKYGERITYNVEGNTPSAILLMVYECFVSFVIMALVVLRTRRKDIEVSGYVINPKRYNKILIVLSFIAIAMFVVEPHILNGYRTIFGMGDANYTSLDMSVVVNEGQSGLISRLAMVIGRGVANVLRILIPSAAIIWLSKYKNSMGVLVLIALTPFLIVDGTIGRSLYYSLVLFYLIFLLKNSSKTRRMMKAVLLLSILFLIFYWLIRYKATGSRNSFSEYTNRIVSIYFCGVNVVSGSMNLRADIWTKLVYFVADILKSIPFGNTIFRLGNVDYFQIYFNSVNRSYGMIPPTIGTGKFYFGFFMAPIYSAVFTAFSILEGEKAVTAKDPFQKITHLISALFFALSFNMYSVQNTFSLIFWIVIPTYIIGYFARARRGLRMYSGGKVEEYSN